MHIIIIIAYFAVFKNEKTNMRDFTNTRAKRSLIKGLVVCFTLLILSVIILTHLNK